MGIVVPKEIVIVFLIRRKQVHRMMFLFILKRHIIDVV